MGNPSAFSLQALTFQLSKLYPHSSYDDAPWGAAKNAADIL